MRGFINSTIVTNDIAVRLDTRRRRNHAFFFMHTNLIGSFEGAKG